MKNQKKKNKLLPIHVIGDKVLRQKAEPVKEITDEILDFIDDLIYTMYERDGVGLAAPQVGKSLRIFVVDEQWAETNEPDPVVFINPVFKKYMGEITKEEGCLSLPGIYAEVKRPEKVIIEATAEDGEIFEMEADGLLARALLHETDHLDGILFVDHLSKIKRMGLKRKIKELEAKTDDNGNNIWE